MERGDGEKCLDLGYLLKKVELTDLNLDRIVRWERRKTPQF